LKRWLAAALLAWAPGVAAQWAELSFVDPGLRWRTLETARFHVHFAERHREQARVVAGIAEAVLPRVTGLLRWRPGSPIQLVVLDSADFANGFASSVPFNYTMVFLSTPDEGELMQNREWLELVLTHEIFHIVHLDMARRAPLALRRVFGRLPYLFPNLLQPPWVMEGLAVHAESDAKRSYGRLGNAHFEAMMRAEASRGFRSLSEVNAGGRGFPLNRDYLYGGYFFAFLQDVYGQKAVSDFIENYSDNVIPFRIHSNPVIVTGKNMDDLWAEYHAWLKARFSTRPDTALEGDVLERDFSLTSPALAPDGVRWYIRYDGYRRPRLMVQAPGKEAEAVRGVEQDARLALSPGGTAVLSQPNICGNYNYYYDVSRVMPDGDVEHLTRCARVRHAAPLDDGRVVAVRIEHGVGRVVVLDAQGKESESLYRAAPGEALTGVAARGSSIVVTSLRDGHWSLIGITGGRSQVLLSDQAVKHSPRIGERDEVFFIADYGKVFNVWSLGRGGQLSRWTNAAHGVREISAPHRGEMMLTTIEADGDALRLLRLGAEPLEQLTALTPEPPVSAEFPAAELPDRPYSPWYSLLPRSWLPLITIADGAVAFGVTTFGQDALALHQYAIAPQYEATQGELLGSVAYIYDRRHLLLADRVMRVKSTTSDDEIRSYTINDRAEWLSTWRSLSLDRRFYWGLGGALEREKLHELDTATVTGQDERALGLVAGFDSRRGFWLSEGPSQGMQLRLFAETSHGLRAAFSGDVYRVDWRGHVALGKTVLSLRWNEAWGEPDAEAFQLGGSDTDLPTLLPILNQREFALRGYTSGAPGLVGHRARVGTLEWRVPLKDVDRHAMVPPVGLNRLSMNAFIDVGAAWPRGGEADYRTGIGLELMSEIRVGYLFGADLRLGVARGLDEEGKSTAYLRIGRSF
jgi:hypothetical protein